VAINKPTYQNIVDRIRSSLVSSLPDLDPTVYGSVVRAIADSLAGRSFDMIQLFSQLEKNLFPDTASGEYLERWGRYEGLLRKPASKSAGYIDFVGTPTILIPADTRLNSKAGNTYVTQQDVTLGTQILGISSLTETGGIATAVTVAEHGYGTGLTVTIAGATPVGYNGDFVITAISENSFTYQVTSGLDDATGDITTSFEGGFSFVESEAFEGDTDTSVNIGNSSKLTLTSPIAGVESIAYVSFDGIVGALLIENDKGFFGRILSSRKNPVANFNAGRIEKTALSIVGVTRVKVKRITPVVGAVTVLFVRDYDDNIVPKASQITEVRNAILEYLPANSDENFVYVKGPELVPVDFTFTSLDPDTVTMRAAIISNLQAFFQDEVEFEEDIVENIYKGIIASTIDTDTADLSNNKIKFFTLSAPIGTKNIITDQLAVLGDVTFNLTS
jgi:uncharacterized phage protein gp47/JayE